MNNQEIPDELAIFLSDAGLSKRQIHKSNMGTRLYHDLGMYGDIAWGLIEELGKKINMSRFCFERHFPPEFYGNGFCASTFFSIMPFASLIRRRRESYTPITIRMVSESLAKGEWIDPLVTDISTDGASAPQ